MTSANSKVPAGAAVAAVVVTFNRRDVVLRCLDRLLNAAAIPTHVVVVDNGSSDDTVQAIKTTHPDAVVLQMTENLGPAGGFARGMVEAARLDCDWLMLLNDDCIVEPDTLRRLLDVAASADPRVGVVAPTFREGDADHVGLLWKHLPVSVYSNHVGQGSRPIDIDMVTFSGPLVRTDLVRRLGPPREDYFMMWEEWEYCLRVRRHGYRVVAVPGCYIDHPGGGSLGSPPWREYYQARNHLRTVLDRRDPIDFLFWLGREIKVLAARLLYANRKGTRIQLRLRGAIHAVRGRMGRTVNPSTPIGQDVMRTRRRAAVGSR